MSFKRSYHRCRHMTQVCHCWYMQPRPELKRTGQLYNYSFALYNMQSQWDRAKFLPDSTKGCISMHWWSHWQALIICFNSFGEHITHAHSPVFAQWMSSDGLGLCGFRWQVYPRNVPEKKQFSGCKYGSQLKLPPIFVVTEFLYPRGFMARSAHLRKAYCLKI